MEKPDSTELRSRGLKTGLLIAALLLALACLAARAGGSAAALIDASAALVLAWWIYRDCSIAAGLAMDALARLEDALQ